ncbi:MAG: hypothetical protein ACK4ZY_12255, partial [Sphingomonas sp.]
MTWKNTVSFAALAGSLALAASPALAQTTADDTNAVQPQTDPAPETRPQSTADKAATISGQAADTGGDGEIVVTGTRIQRPNIAAAAPITSVTAADIKAQAPVNV